jgi:hypothetical protein
VEVNILLQEVIMANRIPPDATAEDGITNDERASWAEAALLTFGKRTGSVVRSVGDTEEPMLVVGDLLADIAHWCDRHNVDLQAAIQYGTRHYQLETGAEGAQLV